MATKEKRPAESPADTTASEPTAVEPTSATKRKASEANADAEEIEVDLAAPEPPSKRARRALKKGKVLPKKPDSDDENGDAKEDGKGKKEKVRSEHGVWIGNLPFTVTQAQLRKWLVDNSGGVLTEESITRLKLPTSKLPGREKKDKPENKGFAYVDFSDIGGKLAAIGISESDLGGRQILIKDSKSFEGRPEKQKEPENAEEAEPKKDESRKVFVGNMSFKTTEDDLRRNFEKCGEIDWVKVATFEDTGKCKGYGWVKFREAEGAAWAVKGFVKIKEAIETEDDFKESKDEGSDDEPKERQFKTRKWWVNRMLGRELKLELAEDDQSRYKKRFRGEGAKERAAGSKPSQERKNRANGDGESEAAARPMKEATDIQVARLTGAVVKHTGSKMTFD